MAIWLRKSEVNCSAFGERESAMTGTNPGGEAADVFNAELLFGWHVRNLCLRSQNSD
ncbi:MAG: hypothetical protein M2R45_04998 [Verrucomicrobia subdivision 3 bacterium]|nr:hypothetical protein [Limisphaerales bacterium]MCS1415595.1 hypothetical protein [Limisphaerales bacterium]